MPAFDDENSNSDSSLPRAGNLFHLHGSVGDLGDNDRQDVIKTQVLLGNAGYYDLLGLGGPTGWPGSELTRGLRRFQKDRGLAVDGVMLPDGETIKALRDELSYKLRAYDAPSPEEADQHHAESAQRGEDDDRPRSSVVAMPEGNGQAEHPPGVRRPDSGAGIQSDVPAAAASHRPGAQYAQVALPPPAPPLPVAGGAAQSQLPQDRPEYKAAAREIDRRIGYAKENADRWLDNAKDVAATLPNLLQGLLPDSIHVSPPSRPSSESDKAQTRTPPLMPSAPPDEPPPDHRHEETTAAPEQLIPPEMQEWIEGLEPFDQNLARSLLAVLNSNGNATTRRGNNQLIVEALTQIQADYPDLEKWISHAGGGTLEGDGTNHHKEEYIKNVDGNRNVHRAGSGRPDITFHLARNIAMALRFNTASQKADGSFTDAEIAQAEKHGRLSRERPPAMVEKLQPGESEAAYRAKIQPRIREAIRQAIDDWKATGEFLQSDPETPAKYRHWYDRQ